MICFIVMKDLDEFKGIRLSVFRRPGGDLLFRVLRRSTIGAGVIYGRVRDGVRRDGAEHRQIMPVA